jgi:hypothetical protein
VHARIRAYGSLAAEVADIGVPGVVAMRPTSTSSPQPSSRPICTLTCSPGSPWARPPPRPGKPWPLTPSGRSARSRSPFRTGSCRWCMNPRRWYCCARQSGPHR